MGLIIKAKRDGFRRAGLVHRAAGTYHPDGELTEQQLEMLRNDPALLVVEDVQEDALDAGDANGELVQQMGDTIASLEHQLEQARAELRTTSSDVVRLLEFQKAAPALVLEAIRALEPIDPATEGAIVIKEDSLVAIISSSLSLEAQDDGRKTLDSSSGTETPPPPQADSPAPEGSAPDVQPVKAEKTTGRRGGAEKKGAAE